MRIRKNRTSSRVTPEFCVTHVEKVEHVKHVDAGAKIEPAPLLQPPMRKQPLDVDELELDAAAILNSLDTQSSSYKIRDFVLAQGDNVKPGAGSENHNCVPRLRQSGSESDTGHPKGSRKRTPKHPVDAKQSKSASVSGNDKINSDTTSSSKARVEETQESAQEQAIAKSEVIDDAPPPATKREAVESASNSRSVGGRKRNRRQVESDSSLGQEIGSTKSEDEEYKYPGTATSGAAAEKGAGKVGVGAKEESMQQQVESTEKSPVANFPMGWSYRGLAQIAEHDKATQGKQCGRTDGRSWRCPLKVQEGFTLCEHHLSKFRLKKLCKGNKKQKSSPQQFRSQQQREQQQREREQQQREREQQQREREQQQREREQQQQQREREREREREQQQQQQREREREQSPRSYSPSPQIEISNTPMPQSPTTTLEHDVPMKFRRRHKTVKLSVL